MGGYSHPFKLKHNLKMRKLTDIELEDLLERTDSFYDCPTEEDKDRMRKAYRFAELETENQIIASGGITQWYEGGRSRVIPDND